VRACCSRSAVADSARCSRCWRPEANRVVPVDRIIDALWPDEPPANARHSVEVYVSGLRKLLGADRVERRGGYLLRLAPGELDVEQFSILVERAAGTRPARARRLLEQGLALVRGEPLTGLEGFPFAEIERARLNELVWRAREALVDARLALGEHRALVAELRACCADEPTRERSRWQLMMALYRSDRQEEALAEYLSTRRALRDELGLEPGNDLRELHRQILRHDPALDPPAFVPPPPANVPAPMHPLIGRDRELAELAELVRADARLVTITGTGGVGKTRLAVALAHDVAAEYEDGAAYAGLVSVRDPALVLSAIARSIGVDEVPGEPLGDTLARALEAREVLLVVDNFEHVLDAGASLTALLAACARLAVVATSRAPLRLYGEHVYRLEPLEVAQPPAPHGEIATAPAVRLFAARARAVQPGFAVDEANAPAVAEICARLDGLPLAIELAAARTSLLTPQALLHRLTNRLDAGEGPRDLHERHRTLRHALTWSYDLLDDSGRRMFRRLGVFVGGFTLDAAARVCAVGEEATTASALATLLDDNLVRTQNDARFELLETVREYALVELEASDEAEETRARHLEYFVDVAEAAHEDLYGARQAEAVARLDTDQPNLLSAAAYAAEANAGALELRLLAALYYYFALGRVSGRARRLFESVLERNADQPVALRAHAALSVAVLGYSWGQPPDARESRGREALALAEETGDDFARWKALDLIGTSAYLRSDCEAAYGPLARAVNVARSVGHPWALGSALNNYGALLMLDGRQEEARAALSEGLESFERARNLDGIAHARTNLGILAGDRGDFSEAADQFAAALASVHRVNQASAFDFVAHIAALAARNGDPVAAGRLLGAYERRREVTSRVLDPIDVDALRRASAAVRDRLAPERVVEAAAEGRALTYEEIVDYALDVARQCRGGAVLRPRAAGSA
jgi:predicted ATPase/DNA-binding SARP family transcriptional activator